MTRQTRQKLTNGFLVIRPGEAAAACLSPSGYAWSLSNQTSRPIRLRVGMAVAIGNEEWRVTTEDGYAMISWDKILPEGSHG